MSRFCRGVWLDRGELDKIIERSTPYNMGKSSDIQRGSDHSERKYYSKDEDYRAKKRKKESFLGDLFDF